MNAMGLNGLNWIAKLPKVEIHVHLEGAIPHNALFNLIQKYGGDPLIPDIQALTQRFMYKDFPQFIEAWIWKNSFLREYEDFSYIAEMTAANLAEQNILYAEMFFSPSCFTHRGLTVQDLTQAIRTGFSRIPQIEIALIADLVRDHEPQQELAILDRLQEVKNLGVIGIGLGGSEHNFPPEPFKPLYEKAQAMGFHTTAHAGEAAGPQSIWGAIRHLGAERIGHGTQAWEDPELVKYLAEHQIPLEMCPGSNVRTGIIRNLSEHPIRHYFDQGIRVTVNTDDPEMFQTRMAQEYHQLMRTCGFTKPEIFKLILNAIDASWLPKPQKTAMKETFKKAVGQIE